MRPVVRQFQGVQELLYLKRKNQKAWGDEWIWLWLASAVVRSCANCRRQVDQWSFSCGISSLRGDVRGFDDEWEIMTSRHCDTVQEFLCRTDSDPDKICMKKEEIIRQCGRSDPQSQSGD